MFEEAVRVVCSEALRLYDMVRSAKQDLKKQVAASSAAADASTFVVLRAVAKMTVFGTCDLTRAVAVAIDSPQAAISAATRQGLMELCRLSEAMMADDPRGKLFVCWLSLEDLHNKGVVGQSTYIFDAVRAEQGPIWEGDVQSGVPAPVKEAKVEEVKPDVVVAPQLKVAEEVKPDLVVAPQLKVAEEVKPDLVVAPRVKVAEEGKQEIDFEPVPIARSLAPNESQQPHSQLAAPTQLQSSAPTQLQSQQQLLPPTQSPVQLLPPPVPMSQSNQVAAPMVLPTQPPASSILDGIFAPLSASSSFQQPSPRLSFLSPRKGDAVSLDDTLSLLQSASIPIDLGIAVNDDGSLELINLASSLQRAMQMISLSLDGAQRQLQMVASTTTALERERSQVDTVMQLISSLGKGVEAIEQRVAMIENHTPAKQPVTTTAVGTQCSLSSTSVETQTEPVIVMHVNGGGVNMRGAWSEGHPRVVGTPNPGPSAMPERSVSPIVPSRRVAHNQRHDVNMRPADDIVGMLSEGFAPTHRSTNSVVIAPPGALLQTFSQYDPAAASPQYFKVSPPHTPLAQFDTKLSHRHSGDSTGHQQQQQQPPYSQLGQRRRLYAFSPPSLAINSQRGDAGEFSSMATCADDEGQAPTPNAQVRPVPTSAPERENAGHHVPETLEEWLQEDALRLLPRHHHTPEPVDTDPYLDPQMRGDGESLSVWDMLERDRRLEVDSTGRANNPTVLYAHQQRQRVHHDVERTTQRSVVSPVGNVAAEWSDAHRLVMARRQQQQNPAKDPPSSRALLIPMTDDLRAGPGLLPARRTSLR